MENLLSKRISPWLIHNNILKKEDIKNFEYGLSNGLRQILILISDIAIGYMMNRTIEVILFLIAYASLRVYAGGYHANNHVKCYLCSVFMVVLALMGVNYIYLYPRICIGVLAISTIIIMKLAPIEAKNKPLEPMEVIVYRRRAITILWILVLIALMLLFLDLHIYFASIVVAIGCVSIMLILGKYSLNLIKAS